MLRYTMTSLKSEFNWLVKINLSLTFGICYATRLKIGYFWFYGWAENKFQSLAIGLSIKRIKNACVLLDSSHVHVRDYIFQNNNNVHVWVLRLSFDYVRFFLPFFVSTVFLIKSD